MKRIVACILACLALVNVSIVGLAKAEAIIVNENFSIRNGITLQSSANDIKNVESANHSTSGAGFSQYITGSRLAYTVTLAGHKVELFYWTDANDTVEQFQYLLDNSNTITEIRSSLINKYGQPNYNHGDLSTLSTKVFALTAGQISILNPSITAYDGWMLQYNDCWVLVELCKIKIPQIGTMGALNYYILSPEEAQSHFVIQGAFEDSIQQSVDNDL